MKIKGTARGLLVKFVIILVSIAAYVLGFTYFYRWSGQAVEVFIVLPILAAACCFGLLWGILAGSISYPVNALLFYLFAEPGIGLFQHARIIGWLAMILIGAIVGYMRNLNCRLRKTNNKLSNALQEKQSLNGLLPICAQCKKIRDEQGYWHQVEAYISTHSEARFTHGICPECEREMEKDLSQFVEESSMPHR